MKVGKNGRVLVVITSLAKYGREDLKWLYRGLEASAVIVARLILGLFYRRIYTLTGEQATAAGFVDRLAELSADPRTQAIDVLLHLHGKERELWFADGAIATRQLKERIAGQQLQGRLRLLYSTACYGANHAPDFVAAGFRVASGAIAVNANAAHDYPTELIYWALGATYEAAMKAGNNRFLTRINDRLAVRFRFTDVNSIKSMAGHGETRITSPAA